MKLDQEHPHPCYLKETKKPCTEMTQAHKKERKKEREGANLDISSAW